MQRKKKMESYKMFNGKKIVEDKNKNKEKGANRKQ